MNDRGCGWDGLCAKPWLQKPSTLGAQWRVLRFPVCASTALTWEESRRANPLRKHCQRLTEHCPWRFGNTPAKLGPSPSQVCLRHITARWRRLASLPALRRGCSRLWQRVETRVPCSQPLPPPAPRHPGLRAPQRRADSACQRDAQASSSDQVKVWAPGRLHPS